MHLGSPTAARIPHRNSDPLEHFGSAVGDPATYEGSEIRRDLASDPLLHLGSPTATRIPYRNPDPLPQLGSPMTTRIRCRGSGGVQRIRDPGGHAGLKRIKTALHRTDSRVARCCNASGLL
ncbi:hypothetical protein GCM10022236_20640 [Microlunatus ginsengisoli]|uniref:Uncharacterized protein n=1 Tax=Microlunatus ginsengisoli TaxID=363863 RepID=A0ABP6ZXZ6_9ACTN